MLVEKKTVNAVIITKSAKNQGFCVTAYDLKLHHIIRFVREAGTGAEIPFGEMRNISVLDLVEVKITEDCPLGPQTENKLVDRCDINRVIKYFGTIEEIRKNVIYPDSNFFMDDSANRLSSVAKYKHSLEIITVTDLVLVKYQKYDKSITTRAHFTYKGNKFFNFRVTDYDFDMRKFEGSTIKIPYADLVVSIPYKNYFYEGKPMGYYKFIAAIYPIVKPVDELIQHTEEDIITENNRGSDNNIILDSESFSYKYWNNDEDDALLKEFFAGYNIQEIAIKHNRSKGEILMRLKKLGMIK